MTHIVLNFQSVASETSGMYEGCCVSHLLASLSIKSWFWCLWLLVERDNHMLLVSLDEKQSYDGAISLCKIYTAWQNCPRFGRVAWHAQRVARAPSPTALQSYSADTQVCRALIAVAQFSI